MGAEPKPTVALACRLDVDTHARRQQLQRKLKCTTPELIRRALAALEAAIKGGAATAA